MRRLIKLTGEIRQNVLPYSVAFILLAASTGLFLLVPPQVGRLLTALSHSQSAFPVAIAVEIGVILFVQAVLMAAYGYIVGVTSERIGNRLRARFFENLISSDLNRIGRRPTGELASEFASDIAIVQAGLSDVLINLLRHALVTTGAAVAMAMVDPVLALLTLGSVAVVALVILGFTHFATKAMVAAQEARASAVALLVESASNAYVIKAYKRERWFAALFRERLDRVYQQVTTQSKLLALTNPITVLILSAALMAILEGGNHQLHDNQLRPADLISFLTYALILVSAISQLGIAYSHLNQSALLFEKNDALLRRGTIDSAPSSTEADRRPTIVTPIGLAATHVTLAMETVGTILHDFSCSVPAGRVTLIVGESGAGKSTLVAVLGGLLQPSAGRVSITGASDLHPSDIAIVPQNPFLFEGTILENIAFGRDRICREDVERAASSAHILDFVLSLPDGFEHVLHEGGRNLSRGQQQRIALARALTGNPGLLILDEATASLDTASELAVKRAILNLKGKMTIIIVAHHGSLRSLADWRIEIVAGRKVFEGPEPEFFEDDVGQSGQPAAQMREG